MLAGDLNPWPAAAASPLSSASVSLTSSWCSFCECPSTYFGSTEVLLQWCVFLNALVSFSWFGWRGSLIQETPVTDLSGNLQQRSEDKKSDCDLSHQHRWSSQSTSDQRLRHFPQYFCLSSVSFLHLCVSFDFPSVLPIRCNIPAPDSSLSLKEVKIISWLLLLLYLYTETWWCPLCPSHLSCLTFGMMSVHQQSLLLQLAFYLGLLL